MADCSELATVLAGLVDSYAKEDRIKTFDDVVKEIMRDIPGVTREDISDSVIAVQRAKEKTRKNPAKVKKEDAKQAGVSETEAAKIERISAKKKLTSAEREYLQAQHDKLVSEGKSAPDSERKARAERAEEIAARLDAAANDKAIPASKKDVKLSTAAQRAALEVVTADPKISRSALVAAVYEKLIGDYPDLTYRTTRDAISSYGVFHQLSKEEAHVALRGMKQEMLKESQLEDWKVPTIPPATGREHALMTDEARRLQTEVNEAKKSSGLVAGDAEENLKTTLQTIKRRAEHQLADLAKQLVDRARTIKEKSSVVLDENSPEVKELRQIEAKRDALKQIFDETFGRNDEQIRIEAQKAKIEAIKDQIVAFRRRPSKNKPKAEVGAELAELNATLKAARKELATMEGIAREADQFNELEAKTQRIISLKATITAAETLANSKDKTIAAQAKERLAQSRNLLKAELAGTARTPSINAGLKAARQIRAEAAREVGIHRTIQALKDRLEADDINPPSPKVESSNLRIEKAELERDQLRGKIRRKMSALRPKSRFDRYIMSPTRVLGSIITTGEFSPVLIQGGFFAMGHPIRTLRDIHIALKGMSDIGERRAMKNIEDRPNWWMYQRGKVAFTEADESLNRREETTLSEMVDRLPILGKFSRFYRVYLNTVRADMADIMIANTRGGNPTTEEMRSIGFMVNAATGRGNLGKYEASASFLANYSFAPRHYVSRVQIITGAPIWKAPTMEVRKAVIKEYARYFAGLGTVLMVSQLLAGEDDDWWKRVKEMTFDPRSTDFLKVRSGDRRIDVMSGFQQFLVTGTRVGLAMGNTVGAFGDRHVNELKRSNGKTVPISGDRVPFGGRTTLGVAGDFLRGKSSPAASIIMDVSEGVDFMGRKINDPLDIPGVGEKDFGKGLNSALRVLSHYAGPITWRSIIKQMQSDHGMTANAASSIVSIFGANVNDYDNYKR